MMPIRPTDREKVETEARAKCFWGDSREEVLKFLMMQGISAAEATEIAEGMFQERAASVRGIGLRKIFIGIPLIVLPFAAWFFFLSMHAIPVKLFGLTIMAGLYGMYSLITGVIMFVSPKSESGDIADK